MLVSLFHLIGHNLEYLQMLPDVTWREQNSFLFKIIIIIIIGEIVHLLRALVALTEDPGLVSRIPWWLTTV